jgi:tagatose kinase
MKKRNDVRMYDTECVIRIEYRVWGNSTHHASRFTDYALRIRKGQPMTPHVLSIGELLVEVMRTGVDQPLSLPGPFIGPFPSGAPAIFIDAVARLGLAAGFIGAVGLDAFGDCVVNRLQADGVDTGHVRRTPGMTTGIAFVSYQADGSRSFVFHLPQSAAAQITVEDVHASYVASAHFLHITGSALATSEGMRQACYRAMDLCKAAGGRVSFDPNVRPELLGLDRLRQICAPVLAQCDVLFPSGAEARFLTGLEDEIAACHSLIEQGIPLVALKQGERGSTVFTSEGSFHAPPLRVEEVDPTGAGDCYDAGFVVGLLEGWPLPRVAAFANTVGALSVTRMGPMEGIPGRDEAERIMNKE